MIKVLSLICTLTMPMGAVGWIGVACIPILILLSWSKVWRYSKQFFVFTAPLSLITVLATLIQPDKTLSMLLSSLGMAFLFLVAPAVISVMRDSLGSQRVVKTFLIGEGLLALSIVADTLLKWHSLPVGLYLRA